MTTTPVSNIPISVDYTGRDYYSLREALIARIQDRIPEWTASDPADFGVALVEAIAYMGDLTAYYIDRSANETFLQTATQRSSILSLAQSYGYIPAGFRQATVDISFSNSSLENITIPLGTVVSGDVVIGDTVQTIYFTTNADSIIDAQVDGIPGTSTVSASEGRSVTLVATDVNSYGELIGTSSGLPGMSFDLGETPVADGSVEIYVQDGDVYSKWTQVQHLLDYNPTDQVYTVYLQEDNTVTINFGDGVSGFIPINYSEIRARYVVGGGVIGNVIPNTLKNIEYVKGFSETQTTAFLSFVTLTNNSSALGGSDPESNDQIRVSAPTTLRAGNRAVTLKDFSDLAQSISGVGKANATASVWTSITLYIAPSRNALDTDIAPGLDDLGNPTPEYLSLKANVEDFLTDKILIGTSVTIQPPSYVDAVAAIGYTKLPQYTTNEVETAIKVALLNGFGYNAMKFQDTIYPQDIEFVLQQTAGVKTVKVSALHVLLGSGLNTLTGTAGQIFRFQEENLSLNEI